jgi:acyl-CoA synthetase (AMP-forming)/AMP-acid ligase II
MIKGKNLFFDYLERKDRKNFKGWFKTGDLCKLKNSKVFLIGRTDNQLNIGGEKVHAEKIEAIIEKGKNVKECICFQTKDKTLLNKIVCLIKIRKMGNFIKFKKLILKRFKNFPAYYKPAILKFLDNLPKTNNGKKLRNQKELAKLYL